MTVGWSMTAIFGDLRGYIFGNVGEGPKASHWPAILHGDMLPLVAQ